MSGDNTSFIQQVFSIKHSPSRIGASEGPLPPLWAPRESPRGGNSEKDHCKTLQSHRTRGILKAFFPSVMPKDRMPHQSCQRDQITCFKIFTKKFCFTNSLAQHIMVFITCCRSDQGQPRGCVWVDFERKHVWNRGKEEKNVSNRNHLE